MQKRIKYTLILTVVSSLAAVGVASTFLLTRNTIKKKELAARAESLYLVLPGLEGKPEEVTPSNIAEQHRVFKGINKSGQVIGYAACGEAQGYSSKIKVMVGIDSNLDRILGIDILSQRETPGLGTKMTKIESKVTLWTLIYGRELKSIDWDSDEWQIPLLKKPERLKRFGPLEKEREKVQPWFQEQFRNKTYNQLIVSKIKDPEKITAITGATISTKAAINAVQDAINKIKNTIQSPSWEIR